MAKKGSGGKKIGNTGKGHSNRGSTSGKSGKRDPSCKQNTTRKKPK